MEANRILLDGLIACIPFSVVVWAVVPVEAGGVAPVAASGYAGARGYKDYAFHFTAFMKASAFSLIVIVSAALVISLLSN